MRIARLLVLAAVVGVVGCGRSDDRAMVRGTTQDFLEDLDARRGAGACAALSEDTRAELVRTEAKPCPEAVASLDVGSGPVERVSVEVENAVAVYAGGERAYLGRTDDGWRLSAVGCRRGDGPPGEYPLDCELAP